ncbi:MAG: aldolase, partial [Deinococcus sp.]|nr:aldolase [Deinococcus sp.]
MKPNKTKQILKNGGSAIGTMVSEFTSPELGRLLAAAGFDFIIIDNENSTHSFESDSAIIRSAADWGLTPLVRVTDTEYHLIARTLDAGAQGLMVPRVETRPQVERIVNSVKYPPVGRRGWGVRPVHTDYEAVTVPETIAHLNAHSLVIIQIETKLALDNLDDLLSVPGVDVALIGPNDLSISLGVPGELRHKKMVAGGDAVVAACQRHGVAAGIHVGNTEDLLFWHSRGMRALMC